MFGIDDRLCRNMNKIPFENECFDKCPHDLMHVYDEHTKSCVYNSEMTKYCNE